MNKIIISCVVYSLLFLGGITYFIIFQKDKTLEVAEGKAILDKVTMENNHSEDVGEDTHFGHNEEFVSTFRNIEDNLSFLVASLIEENTEAFSSMFVPEQYSKDLWANSDDPFGEKVSLKFIKALNRDGTLETASYDTSFMDGYKTTRNDSEVSLTLVYKDGNEANLKLNMIMMGSEHSNKDDIYFIENSVLSLIKEVKEQTD